MDASTDLHLNCVYVDSVYILGGGSIGSLKCFSVFLSLVF